MNKMNWKRFLVRCMVKPCHTCSKEILIVILILCPLFIISLYILDSSSSSTFSFRANVIGGSNSDHINEYSQVKHHQSSTIYPVGNDHHYQRHETLSLDAKHRSMSWNHNGKDDAAMKWNDNNGHISPDVREKVRIIIQKLEDSVIPKSWNGSKVALIRSKNGAFHKDLAFYKGPLKRNGFRIQIESSSPSHSPRRLSSSIPSSSDWILLICLDYTESKDECYSDQYGWSKAQFHGKIDNFVGLEDLFSTKEAFCTTINQIRRISSVRTPFTPLCFVLPAQYQPFIEVSDALGYSTQWIIQPISPSASIKTLPPFTSPQAQSLFTQSSSSVPLSYPLVIDVLSDHGRKLLNDLGNTKTIIRQQVADTLTLFGPPVSIYFFVAITSFHPLRAYVHQQGLVYQRDNQTGAKKIKGHTPWSLVDFFEYINKNFGPQSSSKALKSAYDSITRLLLVSEAILTFQREHSPPPYTDEDGDGDDIGGGNFEGFNGVPEQQQQYEQNSVDSDGMNVHSDIRSSKSGRITSNGVNLIAIEIMLNRTFDAWIVNVEMGNELYRTSKSDGSVFTKVMRIVVDDYIALISSRVRVANEVNRALEWAMSRMNIGIMGLDCSITHEVCLSYDDLAYLLNWRREMAASNNFVPIYPIPASDELQALMNDLSESSIRRKLFTKDIPFSIIHPTWDLNHFLSQMRLYFDRQVNGNIFQSNTVADKISTAKSLPDRSKFTFVEDCDQDTSFSPYISTLHTYPAIILTPTFSPDITQYYSNVSHNLLMITVYATAKHCQSEIRMEGKFGSSRPTNYTLGLGQNKITLVVVDVSQIDPMIINTYTIYIYRVSLVDQSKHQPNPSQVCFIKQKCDLAIYPRDSCGLQRSLIEKNWTQYSEYRESLPVCGNGNEPGKWFVPCSNCQDEYSCDWRKADWHSDSCKYRQFTQSHLSRCLADHKIIFVGDSTNRGLMHYLVEKLNSTLTDGSKTHDMKIYRDLNDRKTLVAFDYYPKFWVPTSKRLTFDQTVARLIRSLGPLLNSSKTVIVFGGVQWLAAQHIRLLVQTLQRLNLGAVKVIMKTLGAGFHQPIDGFNSLSLSDLQKLAAHNANLISLAQKYDIAVLETFNMTMARYTEFYPGKCVCHFHKINEIQDKNSKNDHQTHYHIDGEINAAYAQILLNLLCTRTKND